MRAWGRSLGRGCAAAAGLCARQLVLNRGCEEVVCCRWWGRRICAYVYGGAGLVTVGLVIQPLKVLPESKHDMCCVDA